MSYDLNKINQHFGVNGSGPDPEEEGLLEQFAMAPLRAAEGLAHSVYGLADWATFDVLPDWDERKLGTSTHWAPGLLEGVLQFAVPFGAASKVMGVKNFAYAGKGLTLSKSQKLAAITKNYGRVMGAGAAADFVAFDPHEGRLSDFIQQVPGLKNPISDYLSTDMDDSEFEGRLKNTLEGILVGPLFDTVLKAVSKSVRGTKHIIQERAKGVSDKNIMKDMHGRGFDATDELSTIIEHYAGHDHNRWVMLNTLANSLGLPREKVKADLEGKSFLEQSPEGTTLSQADAANKGYIIPNGVDGVILGAFSRADVSTGVHEFAHAARLLLFDKRLSSNDRFGITDEMIDIAAKESGAIKDADGNWNWNANNNEAEEHFARAFEKYIRDGHSPNKKLKGLMSRLAAFMRYIYRSVSNSEINLDISPEMRGVFDSLMKRGDLPELKNRHGKPLNVDAGTGGTLYQSWKRDKSGRYIGSPDVTSPQQLGSLKKKILDRTLEGADGRFWYRSAAKAIETLAGGDFNRAEKIAAVMAEISPQKSVRENMAQGIRAIQALDLGLDLSGTGKVAEMMKTTIEKVNKAYDYAETRGIKVTAFKEDLVRHLDGAIDAGYDDLPTIDTWVLQAFGYNADGAPGSGATKPQVEFMTKVIEETRDTLNARLADGEEPWTNDQAQAALWVATKRLSPKGKSTADYGIIEGLKDTGTYMALESKPGPTTGHYPELFDAPWKQQLEFHAATMSVLKDDNGIDLIAKELRALDIVEGPGVGLYDGEFSPANGKVIASARDHVEKHKLNKEGKRSADMYSAAMAILTRQDAFAYHTRRQTSTTRVGDSNGIKLDMDEPLTSAQLLELTEQISRVVGDDVMEALPFVATPDGVHILNLEFSTIDNKAFQKINVIIDEVLGDKVTNNHKQRRFQSETQYKENNWKENPNGEEYLKYIEKEYGIEARRELEDTIRRYDSRVVAAQAQVGQKFGWSQGRNLGESYRETGGPRREQGVSLDSPMFQSATPNRVPELMAAAATIGKQGGTTKREYQKLVNELKPVVPYKFVPAPATVSQMRGALSSNKVDKVNAKIKDGTRVGIRLDIPAYTGHGVWVPTIHGEKGGPISHRAVAVITDAEFAIYDKQALRVAQGGSKSPFATINGKWKNTSNKAAVAEANAALKDPDYVQVGFDPERHSYFYDRKTQQPIVGGERVIQVGPLVLVKNPKTTTRSKVLFQAEQGKKFRTWFGDSKVVDADGNPLVVYHGTKRGGFSEFDTDSQRIFRGVKGSGPFDQQQLETIGQNVPGSGPDVITFLGSHFSQEKSVAKGFISGEHVIRGGKAKEGDSPQLYETYLSIDNPLETTEYAIHELIIDEFLLWDAGAGKLHEFYLDYANSLLKESGIYDSNPELLKFLGKTVDELEPSDVVSLKENGFLDRGTSARDVLEGSYISFRDAWGTNMMDAVGYEQITRQDADAITGKDMLGEQQLAHALRGMLRDAGFDGIKYENAVEGGTSWIAFDPEQIKSVDNDGTFDADNPNIYFQSEQQAVEETVAWKPERLDKLISLNTSRRRVDGDIRVAEKPGSKAAVAWINPLDYIKATVGQEKYVEEIIEEAKLWFSDKGKWGRWSYEKMGTIDNDYAIPQLFFNTDGVGVDRPIGRIDSHEGRHRMAMMHLRGVKEVPVLLRFRRGNLDEAIERRDDVYIKGQKYFKDSVKSPDGEGLEYSYYYGKNLRANDAIALHPDNREEILERMGNAKVLFQKANSNKPHEGTIALTLDSTKFFHKTYDGLLRFNDNDRLAQAKKNIGGKDIEWELTGLNALLERNPDATIREAKETFRPVEVQESILPFKEQKDDDKAEVMYSEYENYLHNLEPGELADQYVEVFSSLEAGHSQFNIDWHDLMSDLREDYEGLMRERMTHELLEAYKPGDTMYGAWIPSGINPKTYRELSVQWKSEGSTDSMGNPKMPTEQVHLFGDNTMYHVRFADIEEDGKKLLYVFEMQSDWARKGQVGRWEGSAPVPIGLIRHQDADNYVLELDISKLRKEIDAKRRELKKWNENTVDKYKVDEETSQYYEDLSNSIDELSDKRNDLEKQLHKGKKLLKKMQAEPTPVHPFKNTWLKNAIERMFKLAAEEGYDGIRFADTEAAREVTQLGTGRFVDIGTMEDPAHILYGIQIPKLARKFAKKKGVTLVSKDRGYVVSISDGMLGSKTIGNVETREEADALLKKYREDNDFEGGASIRAAWQEGQNIKQHTRYEIQWDNDSPRDSEIYHLYDTENEEIVATSKSQLELKKQQESLEREELKRDTFYFDNDSPHLGNRASVIEPSPMFQEAGSTPRSQQDPDNLMNWDKLSNKGELNDYVAMRIEQHREDLGVRDVEDESKSLETQRAEAAGALEDMGYELGIEVENADTLAILKSGAEKVDEVAAEIGGMRSVLVDVSERFMTKIGAFIDEDGIFTGNDVDLVNSYRERQIMYEAARTVSGILSTTGRLLGSYRFGAQATESLGSGQKPKGVRPDEAASFDGSGTLIPEVKTTKEAEEILNKLGGREAIIKSIQQDFVWKEMNPGSTVPPTRSNGLLSATQEYWMNNILSGVTMTHAANITSGIMRGLIRPLERSAGALFSGNLKQAKRELRELRYFFGEINDAIKISAYAARTGEAQLVGYRGGVIDGKAEINAISAAGVGQKFGMATRKNRGTSTAGKVLDWFGGFANLPSRFLMAEDEFFKQMNYRANMRRRITDFAEDNGKDSLWIEEQMRNVGEDGQMYSQSTLKRRAEAAADRDNLKGKERAEFIAERVTSEWNSDVGAMAIEARQTAREATFTQDLKQDVSSQGITAKFTGGRGVRGSINYVSATIANMSTEVPMLKFIFPFVRTPANILQFFLDRSVGALSDKLRYMNDKTLRESMEPEARADLNGRLATAGALFGSMYALASSRDENGLPILTGAGPIDSRERKIWESYGWQQYSIRVGDKYVSYRRMDPFAIFAGLVADMTQEKAAAELLNRNPEMGKAMIVALTNNLTNKSYLTGAMNMARMLNSPEREFQFIKNTFVSGFAPMSGFTSQAINPMMGEDYVAEVRNTYDAFIQRTPGGYKDLPLKRNVLGDKIKKSEPFPFMLFGPTPYTEVKNDALSRELVKIGAGVSPPSKTTGGVDWTNFTYKGKDTAYDRWMELHGKVKIQGRTLKQQLNYLIRDKRYQALSALGNDDLDSPRVAMMRKWISLYRAKAKAVAINEMPELAEALAIVRYNQQAIKAPGATPDQLIEM